VNEHASEVPENGSRRAPSPVNARRTGAGIGPEELTASIAAHDSPQNPQVRLVLDGEGQDTGRYEVVAGARGPAAMKLFRSISACPGAFPYPVQSSAKLILAENVVREPLHPADQVKAGAIRPRHPGSRSQPPRPSPPTPRANGVTRSLYGAGRHRRSCSVEAPACDLAGFSIRGRWRIGSRATAVPFPSTDFNLEHASRPTLIQT
jgi:hypothetical protein